MKKVIILMGRYCPGHKDGGPIRSIANLTGLLGDEYLFHVVCLDRDAGDALPYKNIKRNEWNCVGKAWVWYLPPGGFTFSTIHFLTRDADVIYSCGFYDDYGYKTLLLKRFGFLKKTRIAVASMGTFSPGALAIKYLKKKIFITACKILGLFKNIVWSVSSELEKVDVERNIGKKACCVVASNIPRMQIFEREANYGEGTLSVAFLSRISPKKNLYGAIKTLQKYDKKVDFYIYGPAEDQEYWESCQKQLALLPPNITWHYGGDIPTDDVLSTLGRHDVFLFPTFGENYGHVIFEALAAGCIPIISDQTPWQCIADHGAGYVLPLSDTMNDFVTALRDISEKSVSERTEMMKKAQQLAADKIAEAKKYTGYRTIFDGNY